MKEKTVLKKVKAIFPKWKNDYIFKTIISSLFSFGITILFALYNGFLGIYLFSIWHGSICVFYFLLVILRGMILLTEKNIKGKVENEKTAARYKTFTISSAMLLLLNLALIFPIMLMVKFKKPVNMQLIPAITMAAYTTYKITLAFMHVHKQRITKHKNILITELRVINLIDALVSILTLQNTLIMVKSTGASVDNMLVLSAISSAAVYIIILIITACFIRAGHKQ